MIYLVFVVVSLAASVIGSICGIGGGVIIKPVLDATGLYSVSTVSFLSGCVVLSMSAYSVIKAHLAGEYTSGEKETHLLAVGAALGGIAGKLTFDVIKSAFDNANAVGAVQAAALFAATLATVVYTANERKIHTRAIKNSVVCMAIGGTLGMMSAFLGIGGGPINLAALSFFFSMDTKTAAKNSLQIILISQLANLLFTVVRGTVPDFPVLLLLAMVLSGIVGGSIGRHINAKIDNKAVKNLFIAILCVIMCICIYNFVRFY